jgi:hypothetical protein
LIGGVVPLFTPVLLDAVGVGWGIRYVHSLLI